MQNFPGLSHDAILRYIQVLREQVPLVCTQFDPEYRTLVTSQSTLISEIANSPRITCFMRELFQELLLNLLKCIYTPGVLLSPTCVGSMLMITGYTPAQVLDSIRTDPPTVSSDICLSDCNSFDSQLSGPFEPHDSVLLDLNHVVFILGTFHTKQASLDER